MIQEHKKSTSSNNPPASSIKHVEKLLRRETGKAIQDYNMIEDNDHVMVCISGGKDSLTLLDILLKLRQRAPVKFSITAINLDQHHPGFPIRQLADYLRDTGVDYKIISENTHRIVKDIVPEGKTMCSLCSRLRRGILYKYAQKNGMNKIALGHHRDDIIETLFLNMFYGGKLKAMPPKLLSDNGYNIVIRPLAYCREVDIKKYATLRGFPIIPCNLCGSQDNLQRQVIKRMLAKWERTNPGRTASIFRSLRNIVPSHLVDNKLYDFSKLGDLKTSTVAWLPEGNGKPNANSVSQQTGSKSSMEVITPSDT
ncbi:MAG: tRNA 2-thiocytidine(32) synthetase TtcA [Acidiferrobacteraceae bacterium]|nr:tRNA 2-thiocytidine(32) synthetase TtcA [Acidiferrobacteraceae bacterium]|tara:strand:+ start:1568 stop:2500 length:933 start_codon:yes stop_codon:yes gene_type:complete